MINIQLEELLRDNLDKFTLSESFGQRSVGDLIESRVCSIIQQTYPDKFIPASSNRSVEDLALSDNRLMLFDVKTHSINPNGFSMPNLISIDRLRKTLSNDNTDLSYIFVSYKRDKSSLIVEDVKIKYIWELDWEMLAIQSLGKGQLQITNANNEKLYTDIGRDMWLKILKIKAIEFYNRRLEKINKYKNSWK